MAQLCLQCAGVAFGPGAKSSFSGQTDDDMWALNQAAVVLCEGCGPTTVSPNGSCVSQECDLHRQPFTLTQIFELGEKANYPIVFTLTKEGEVFTAQFVGHDRVCAVETSSDAKRATDKLLHSFTKACKGGTTAT